MYENPYVKYKGMQLSTDKFIKIATEEFPDSFRHYCEIIILENGKIELASPSHQCTLFRIAMMSEDDIPECMYADIIEYLSVITGSIVVWYGFQKGINCNKAQRDTLNELAEHDLIIDNFQRLCIHSVFKPVNSIYAEINGTPIRVGYVVKEVNYPDKPIYLTCSEYGRLLHAFLTHDDRVRELSYVRTLIVKDNKVVLGSERWIHELNLMGFSTSSLIYPDKD